MATTSVKQKRQRVWILAVILVCGAMTSLTSCISDNIDTPVVYSPINQVLAETGLFSDIRENPDTMAMEDKAAGLVDYQSQYSMFITQPVNHDQPGGDTFKQKVCILFRGYDRPTIMVTEGYFFDGFYDVEDIGINLNANMVHVEHRNFGESYTNDVGQWKYETAAQVSADLHAVYQALKGVFKGKWMSAGTSKSGETSMDYAYYYPNDMDLATSFCSPFMVSLADKRFGEYVFNEVSTESVREIMKKSIRWALTDGEEGAYKLACDKFKKAGIPVPSFTEYVYNSFDAFFSMFQSTPSAKHQEEIDNMTNDENSLVVAICYNILCNRYPEIYYTTFVDDAKEQGFFDPGYDYYADLLDGTSFKVEDVFPIFLKEEDHRLLKEYDNSLRIDQMENFFANTTMPLLFFYSHDDTWTAARPNKLGPNAKMIINPIGHHSPQINNPETCPPEIRQEVMDFITTYIY